MHTHEVLELCCRLIENAKTLGKKDPHEIIQMCTINLMQIKPPLTYQEIEQAEFHLRNILKFGEK